jgi:hypothetical protein
MVLLLRMGRLADGASRIMPDEQQFPPGDRA